jgi:hypothetical protein
MDRQYIRDQQVIERYLSGTLTADEEQAFEEVYLGDSELLNQLEAAERLRDGIKGIGAEGLERSRPRWQQTFGSPRYAMAASVLLAVSLGFSTMLYRENQTLRSSGGSASSPVTRLVAIETVRGGNVTPIPASAQDEWTVLQFDVRLFAYDTYRGVLARRDGDRTETIWSRADLQAQPDGTVLIGPGRALQPGSYEVQIDGRMNAWPAERFDEITRTVLTVIPRN